MFILALFGPPFPSMAPDPSSWRNANPGDLSDLLPEIRASHAETILAAAHASASGWADTPLSERIERLRSAQKALHAHQEELAQGICREIGKPITEARGEAGALVAKIDFAIGDAERFLAEETPNDVPQPSRIRRRPRGPGLIIGPFNFPLHLSHGPATAHLLAGNPVILKPSPLAAWVCARYAELVAPLFPPGVFQIAQGGAQLARALAFDPRIRSVVFTGSVPAGRALLSELASLDPSKDVALELGGKNATLILRDADFSRAANAVAEAACLTAGQRCNATARVLVDQSILSSFLQNLVPAFGPYQAGWPADEKTKLGPLTTSASVERYRTALKPIPGVSFLLPGKVHGKVGGRQGHYVEPCVRQWNDAQTYLTDPSSKEEFFAPVVDIVPVEGPEAMIAAHNAVPFGLSASIFTTSRKNFEHLANHLHASNVYANLPTTFSPSALPFGGWGESGNHHPGGRGFIRFASDEQVLQEARDTLS
ncbi:MAG: aldehyde dehydrogenase family protein [Verrucomicrobia bacterium]|nr:aldehyde dehydrogenase family protein [Verrucomicrobiota bacterium]